MEVVLGLAPFAVYAVALGIASAMGAWRHSPETRRRRLVDRGLGVCLARADRAGWRVDDRLDPGTVERAGQLADRMGLVAHELWAALSRRDGGYRWLRVLQYGPRDGGPPVVVASLESSGFVERATLERAPDCQALARRVRLNAGDGELRLAFIGTLTEALLGDLVRALYALDRRLAYSAAARSSRL